MTPEEAARVDDSYNAHDGYARWWTHVATNLVVVKTGTIPTHVLDVGCGTGRMAEAFAERSFEVTAIDSSPEMVAIASRRLSLHAPSKAEIATGTVLPYADKQFDLAFIFGVLHCIQGDAEGLLRKAARCGKVVFCVEPNILNPYFFLSTYVWSGLQERIAGYPRGGNEKPLRLPKLRTLAEQSGLEIVHSGNISAAKAYGGVLSSIASLFKGPCSSHIFFIAKEKSPIGL